MAYFDREVIPERRMHAKGSGAFGTFKVTHDITEYTKADIFSEVGKETEMLARFSTVAGKRGAADAERDIGGFALKFYTEEADTMETNPFDLTKMWLKEDFPLMPVGEFELNRNPDNYFAQIEQAAFNPANAVPGISF